MIKSVALKDFRRLTDLEVPLSSVTMLTGINGAGKTSVLEGLYCLFSQEKLDVSVFSRYNKSVAFRMEPPSAGIAIRENYDYRLYWNECPTYGKNECAVYAMSDDSTLWSWRFKRAKLTDLDKRIIAYYPIPLDASSDFALWDWNVSGKNSNDAILQESEIGDHFQKAQLLTHDKGLYLLPNEEWNRSLCKYLNFASMKLLPQKLPYQTAKQLTEALHIIDPRITDVRLADMESGLSVVLNGEREVSLGTIGNGALTWACMLIEIFEMNEAAKQQPSDIPIFVLIDEIGAGIHYSIMLEVWDFLKAFCCENRNIQFVFTSHSDDCIRSYCEAFSTQDDAAVVRLHLTAAEEKIVSTEYKKEAFRSIIDGEWEVRG